MENTALCQALAAAVPTLYAALSALDANQMEVAAELLHDTPCVWVGNGFQPPSRVTPPPFQSQISASFSDPGRLMC